MDKEYIKKLTEEAIAENPAMFLVSLNISTDNSIEILIDEDEGLKMEEAVRVSRHVEHNLNRDEVDFSLKVSSPGVGNPLIMPRQYIKNIGRTLKVTKNDETKDIEGKIESADENGVVLTYTVKESKPTGKGKITVEKKERIEYDNIKKAVVKITF
ncbi:MAG: ribosome assembly cofactor RimP [Weeksellaceae bacterium]